MNHPLDDCRERLERIRDGNVEELAFCIEALFAGGDPDDPDASFVGALAFSQFMLGFMSKPRG